MFENFDMSVFLVITLTVIGTFILRVSGLLLAEKIPNTPKFNKFMDTLPGTILLAIVVPTVIDSGQKGIYAVVVTVICMLISKNILLSMVIGMLSMMMFRYYL